MALGDPYVSTAEAKEHAQITDASDDVAVNRALRAVCGAIDTVTRRQFNDAGDVSARIYRPATSSIVEVDDFHTTSGLIVEIDTDDDGVFDTTLAAADYTLDPVNGVVNGRSGFPYRYITVHDRALPVRCTRPSVRVTARWGWAAVPWEVRQAVLIQFARTFGRKHAPHGIVGQGDYVFRVTSRADVQLDPDVRDLLAPPIGLPSRSAV